MTWPERLATAVAGAIVFASNINRSNVWLAISRLHELGELSHSAEHFLSLFRLGPGPADWTGTMGKATDKAGGFLAPKAISNRIKAKGLTKLRWYCQLCEKACRDENGYKCHMMSEAHLRQVKNISKLENPYPGCSDAYYNWYRNRCECLLRIRHHSLILTARNSMMHSWKFSDGKEKMSVFITQIILRWRA
jgi:hypothetical protein